MAGLIVAGEAVFVLPFHLTRFFRPTVLEVFQLTNTELGAAQGVYGLLAMVSYFLGGPLADRFPARKLLAMSLWTTAAGGLYMATFPGYRGSLLLWGFFGVTTIFLFWAALIRATRDWGGHAEQGRAYGLLDGGRGALSALLASVGVLIFGFTFPEGYAEASFADKQEALRIVIYGYTLVTAATGFFVWFVISDGHQTSEPELAEWRPHAENLLDHVFRVLRIPAVWLQALIVLCAYVGYKGSDNYALYAVQGYGMDEVAAARLVAIAAWMRPVAAIAAGLLGDRFNTSRIIVILFVALLASDLYFALSIPAIAWVFIVNTLLGFTALFGLRALYFALFEEARVSPAVTGTAVGVVSVIGFTPDVFVTFVGGILLDRSPGLTGHQHYFMFLAAFAAIGVVASYVLMRMLHAPPETAETPNLS